MRFPRIIVLQDGVVVGDGTVQQLLELCPAFRAMFADQFEASAGESSSEGDAVLTLPVGR